MARGRSKKGLEEKVKELDPAYYEEIANGETDFIKEKLFKMTRYENDLLEAKKDDMDLASKKEAAKVANETYSVPLNAIKVKRAFALKILASKGVS